MSSGFHLADVMREYPSRRFDPKTKRWLMPLVAANIRHYEATKHKYDYQITDPAAVALHNFEILSAGPKHVPFPTHVYDFGGRPPFPHQRDMLDLAWGLSSWAWFAEMGTGKTFAAIHFACAKYKAGEIDRLAIICPSTLRRTWMKELKKYATVPYDFRIHQTKDPNYVPWCAEPDEPGVLKILAVSVEGLGVSESLFESAKTFWGETRSGTPKVMAVCDESSRIKNHKALRTGRAIELGGLSAVRGILNGTPIALGLHDLWSQYEFLDPNILGCGDYWAFKNRYVEMGGYELKQIVGYTHVDELMNLVQPYTKVVSKKVLDLPPKIPKERWVEPTPEQRQLFKLIIKGSTGDPNDPLIKVENTLERMLRLRQVVGGYLPRGHVTTKMVDGLETEVIETVLEPLKDNPKMDDLFEMIKDNHLGNKFIIWSTFVHEIEFIRDQLAFHYGKESVECYYGKTPMDDRSRIEDRYCRDSTMRFFVGNPTAAGLGLTLISGENDVMVYYSGTSAFIDRAQSEDRAHRLGTINSVVVMDLLMEKSVDLVIAEATARKMDISEFVKERLSDGTSTIKFLENLHSDRSEVVQLALAIKEVAGEEAMVRTIQEIIATESSTPKSL